MQFCVMFTDVKKCLWISAYVKIRKNGHFLNNLHISLSNLKVNNISFKSLYLELSTDCITLIIAFKVIILITLLNQFCFKSPLILKLLVQVQNCRKRGILSFILVVKI